MMKFLIQVDKHGCPLTDDGYHLLRYAEWNHDIYSVYTFTSDYFGHVIADENVCPVGTLEFVKFYHSKLRITDEALNIPIGCASSVRRDLHLNLDKESVRAMFETATTLFIKTYVVKDVMFASGVYNRQEFDALPVDDQTRFFVSSVVDFGSEWRCFVFDGQCVGIKHYQGDEYMCPDKYDVMKFVQNSTVKNGTVDIGYIHSDSPYWTVVECHKFYSCGLYGFDSAKIPYMLWRTYKQLLMDRT